MVTSFAFTVREQAECGRGKPVVTCILAFSLVFHTVTPECSSFRENSTYFRPIPNAGYVVFFVERLMAREERCPVTDRLTHTHDNYRNLHCVCMPRVNEQSKLPCFAHLLSQSITNDPNRKCCGEPRFG